MPPFTPTASTRVFALLGDPVAHSLSPRFQNAALRHFELDAVYIALRCDAASVGPLIRALCRAHGGGNVSVPHKANAALCLDRATDAVRRTGACNTFWGEDGSLCGDNTDVAGFHHAATALVPSLDGARALIIGAGGAAAAAVCALLDDGAAHIALLNRSPDRASTLAARADPGGSVIRAIRSIRDVHGLDFDLVINASSVGLEGDETLPFQLDVLNDVGAVLDLVYRKQGGTPFVRLARAAGIPAADGTGMLIGQGAAAFSRWFAVDPPIDLMQRALTGE
ncbi:shikimate dehydrogenase [soil metagenome]